MDACGGRDEALAGSGGKPSPGGSDPIATSTRQGKPFEER
jgi:hypothetical protein